MNANLHKFYTYYWIYRFLAIIKKYYFQLKRLKIAYDFHKRMCFEHKINLYFHINKYWTNFISYTKDQ